MGGALSSPESPRLTEKNIESQEGKVFLITGSTSGIGRELAQILYAAHATVWIVARSKSKGEATVKAITEAAHGSRGQLKLLELDLNDLRTVKPAVLDFMKRESKLDVLWNNAGVMIPPAGTVTAQGYEAQMGVNALAPFLFTRLLADALVSSAGGSSNTRVVWLSSSAAARFSPQSGVDLEALGKIKTDYSQWQNYGMSKAAAILQSAEFARRYAAKGFSSVSTDPGNLDTGLYQHMPKAQLFIVKRLALKPAIFGSYTELFAGLGQGVDSGAWVVPWGKVAKPREDIEVACRSTVEGGDGTAEKFWEWCEKETQAYA